MSIQSAPSRAQHLRRVVGASLAGTVIEWYEFFVYGTASALVFSKLFFPKFDPFVGTLLSLSTFAVAFVARPVGAAIFGHFGDRVGRKSLLVISLSMMGGCTFLMGLLPTYSQVGVWAPILLVALRVIQGISLGGEYGGAVLMSIEHADPKNRGMLGGIINTGASCGLILANLVFIVIGMVMPDQTFLSWGWRIPFLLSFVLFLIGMMIRLRVAESPQFKAVQESGQVHKMPLGTVLTKHLGSVILVALSYLPSGAAFYLAAVFSLSYGTATLGVSRTTMLWLVLLVNVFGIAGIIYAGHLSDTHSRRMIFQIGGIGMVFTPWIWFLLVNTKQVPMMLLGFVLLFIPFCLSYGAMPAFFAQVFPPEVRYSGLAVGYSIGTVFGSGLSPLIATSLLGKGGNWQAVAAFISVMGVISVIATLALRERYAKGTSETAAQGLDTETV